MYRDDDNERGAGDRLPGGIFWAPGAIASGGDVQDRSDTAARSRGFADYLVCDHFSQETFLERRTDRMDAYQRSFHRAHVQRLAQWRGCRPAVVSLQRARLGFVFWRR